MEYCDGGDLSQYLRKYRVLPEAQAFNFAQQLSNALKVLWEKNLIHRDIKPQNLLLSNNNGNFVLKLADFGFARIVRPLDLAETLCGSPLYMVF
jgi:serine/threonine-protein kinase ULK/ATG1